MYSLGQISRFLEELKGIGSVPKNIDITTHGKINIVNVYDYVETQVINYSVMTGIDLDPTVALMKALVEYIERQAMVHAIDQKRFKSNRGSTGMAGFPIIQNLPIARVEARNRALAEAVERYVWGRWWDDTSIDFAVTDLSPRELEATSSFDLVNLIDNSTPLSRILKIQPGFRFENLQVVILFAELKTGGFISGGAAGSYNDEGGIYFRGFSEMLRHSLGVARMESNSVPPVSDYELRLHFFTQYEGTAIVRDRLNRRGDKPIEFPDLEIDQMVEHPLSKLVCVHHCLFENQPEFLEGKVERLCL